MVVAARTARGCLAVIVHLRRLCADLLTRVFVDFVVLREQGAQLRDLGGLRSERQNEGAAQWERS